MFTRTLLSIGLAWIPLLAAAQENQPNIVVMLSDDMGWGQVGCQGGTVIATPNIDSIASEGVSHSPFPSLLGAIASTSASCRRL